MRAEDAETNFPREGRPAGLGSVKGRSYGGDNFILARFERTAPERGRSHHSGIDTTRQRSAHSSLRVCGRGKPAI